jgi:putative transposase
VGAPVIPAAQPGGRPRTTDRREGVTATVYRLRSGCQWRMLPHDLPPPPDGLPLLSRLAPCRGVGAQARHPAWGSPRGVGPHAGAQGREHREADGADHRHRGPRGSDGGTRLRGRTRHMVVEVLGRLLVVIGPATGLPDREGANPGRSARGARVSGLQRLWADGGDAGKRVAWVAPVLQRTLVLVKRPRHTRGLQVRQWRWLGERPFGWRNRARRRRQDCEAWPETTATGSRIAMLQRMVRRLAASA